MDEDLERDDSDGDREDVFPELPIFDELASLEAEERERLTTLILALIDFEREMSETAALEGDALAQVHHLRRMEAARVALVHLWELARMEAMTTRDVLAALRRQLEDDPAPQRRLFIEGAYETVRDQLVDYYNRLDSRATGKELYYAYALDRRGRSTEDLDGLLARTAAEAEILRAELEELEEQLRDFPPLGYLR